MPGKWEKQNNESMHLMHGGKHLINAIERAVLALAEEVTFINKGVSDETYQNAAKVLDEQTLAQAIMAIITINAWNRIAITTHQWPSLN